MAGFAPMTRKRRCGIIVSSPNGSWNPAWMPNTAQKSAEYEILSLLRRRSCWWRRFFPHGVREEPADCGRWSEKAKRETRKVTKAYGKETQAPVSKATEKAWKACRWTRGGSFCSKSWLFEGAFLLLFSASWYAWMSCKKQQRLCNSIPAAEGLYRICWYARRLGDLLITIPGSTQLFNLFSLIVCHNPSAPSEGSSLLYLPHSLPKNSPHRYDIQIRNTKKAITLYDFSKI